MIDCEIDQMRIIAGYCLLFCLPYLAATAEDTPPLPACALEEYVPDESSPEYQVFMPVSAERAQELVIESMRGIGFVRKKDKKGQMRAARLNTNFGGKDFGNEQLYVRFEESSRDGASGTLVTARTEKTVAVAKGRQELWSKAVLDQAMCLHTLFEMLSASNEIVEPPNGVTLVVSTPVRVVLAKFLYSNDVEPEDQIGLIVAEDVTVDGVVVIQRGARATGIVVDAKKSGGYSVDAKLAFEIREAYAVGGMKIPVQFDSGEASEDWRWSGVGGALGLGGLIGGLALRGNAAGIRTGSEFTALVAEDVAF